MPTPRVQGCGFERGPSTYALMDTNTPNTRGNYESGSDYVLEYGELRFTFNERDFSERVEQAAIKLEFVPGPLEEQEREDLVNLAVNGEVGEEPHSTLGEHVNASWHRLVGAADRPLVHWLGRLAVPGASARPTARSCTGCGDWCSAARGSTSA